MRRFSVSLLGLVLLPMSPSVAQDVSSPPVIDVVINSRLGRRYYGKTKRTDDPLHLWCQEMPLASALLLPHG